MITERTLRKWRKEALEDISIFKGFKHKSSGTNEEYLHKRIQVRERILRMTQELLDQHLLRK